MKPSLAVIAPALSLSAALSLGLVSGTQAIQPETSGRIAPELEVSPQWINSPPLRLADLRGKVVLVDFWTYSCINCLRTVPYLNQWHERYKDRGLVVIGVHAPEFEFEGSHSNVEDAVKRLNIHYPVAKDNDYATWNRYNNIAWPAFYLVDRNGKIALVRYGEGEYDQMENRIRQLLGVEKSVARDNGVDLSQVRTPEIYFGVAHDDHQAAWQRVSSPLLFGGARRVYQLPDIVRSGEFALGGSWSRHSDRASLTSDTGGMVLRFNAAKMHLVAGSSAGAELVVRVDGGAPHRLHVDRPRLYTLFDSNDYREHTIRIAVSGQGFDAYSATFG